MSRYLIRSSSWPAARDTLRVAVKLHGNAAERNVGLNPPWWYQLIVHLVVLFPAQLRYQVDELLSSSSGIQNSTSRCHFVRVRGYDRPGQFINLISELGREQHNEV